MHRLKFFSDACIAMLHAVHLAVYAMHVLEDFSAARGLFFWKMLVSKFMQSFLHLTGGKDSRSFWRDEEKYGRELWSWIDHLALRTPAAPWPDWEVNVPVPHCQGRRPETESMAALSSFPSRICSCIFPEFTCTDYLLYWYVNSFWIGKDSLRSQGNCHI